MLLLLLAGLTFVWLCSRIYFSFRRWKLRGDKRAILGFFHPYCNAGGGGERVLWCYLRKLSRSTTSYKVVIYTGDVSSSDDKETIERILTRAKDRFNVEISDTLKLVFVPLKFRFLAQDTLYKRLTLLGQSFGSILVGIEALLRHPCDVFIDTTGFAFTFPFAKFVAGARVAAYVHYPTISTDMIDSVAPKSIKLVYYRLFAHLYSLIGYFACDFPMVNSSWTLNHIKSLWKNRNTVIVYPPCDTSSLQAAALQHSRKDLIVSIGQFRREKNHLLQLHAFAKVLETYTAKPLKLVLLGSCRGPSDEKRVEELKIEAAKLGIQSDQMEIILNAPFPTIVEYLTTASIGLHTMYNEHFGIGVVEMVAAGLLTIAHNSGGPKEDIITSGETGFLAQTKDEYAECILQALDMPNTTTFRARCSESAGRFSDAIFDSRFDQTLGNWL